MDARNAISSPEATRTVVKWRTPAEELMGIATLARALARRGIVPARKMRLIVPSVNWAVQLQRACAVAGLDTTLRPADNPRAAVIAHYLHTPQPAELVIMLACVDGLIPAGIPAGLAAGTSADTSAGTSADTSTNTPAGASANVPASDSAESPSEASANDASERARRLSESRAAFQALAQSAQKDFIISLFTSIDFATAQSAGIACARAKMQDGAKLAMTRPCPFIAEWGANQPSTVGGQALLRRFGLN